MRSSSLLLMHIFYALHLCAFAITPQPWTSSVEENSHINAGTKTNSRTTNDNLDSIKMQYESSDSISIIRPAQSQLRSASSESTLEVATLPPVSSPLINYLVVARYTDNSCRDLVYAGSHLLNSCYKDFSSYFVIYTASQDLYSFTYYFDSACSKPVGATSSVNYKTTCTESYLSYVSDSSVPPSYALMASRSLFKTNNKKCTSTLSRATYTAFDVCIKEIQVKVSVNGEKGIWSSFTKPDCTGVRSSFNFTPGLCYDDFKIQVMQITTPGETSISTPKNKDDVKNCFAGSETVKLESGEDRQISQIVAGDRVLSADVKGRLSFSEVVFVPHSANRDSAVFVHITTASGRDIKMTKSHVLPAGACGSSSPLPLKHASQVAVSDCVTTVTGEERVLSVGTILAEGLYTVVTKEEFVVVNGIIASPFAHNHALGNLYYHIHRFLYDTAPYLLLSPFFGTLNEAMGVLPHLTGYTV